MTDEPLQKRQKTDHLPSPDLPLPLRGIVDMPDDVLLLIAEWVDPKDLLNLAKFNRRYRSLLLEERNKGVWTDSLATLPSYSGVEFPGCAPDMSPRKFTGVFYSTVCTHCGSERAPCIDHTSRKRVCWGCNESPSYKALGRLGLRGFMHLCGAQPGSFLIEDVFKLVLRSLSEDAYCPGYALIVYDQAMERKESDGLDEFAQYLEDRAKLMDSVVAHGYALQIWCDQKKKDEAEALRRLLQERRDFICSKLIEEGWTEKDFPDESNPGCTRCTRWVCQMGRAKKMTPEDWTHGKGIFIEILEEERAARVALLLFPARPCPSVDT